MALLVVVDHIILSCGKSMLIYMVLFKATVEFLWIGVACKGLYINYVITFGGRGGYSKR